MIVGMLVCTVILSCAGMFVSAAVAIKSNDYKSDRTSVALFVASVFVWAAAITSLTLVV